MWAAILSLSLLSTWTVPDDKEPAEGVIHFKGRNVDVGAIMNGFPYDRWAWAGSAEHNVLYCLKRETNGKYIHILEYNANGPAVVLGSARRISSEDFSKALTSKWKVRESDATLFFVKDENNNEQFNLYSLERSGFLRKLSDVAYVSDFGLSTDGKKVAYSERMGPEGSRYRIHVLDLETCKHHVIARDTKEQQFTWYNLSWQPNGEGIALTTLTDGDRKRGNISYIKVNGNEDQRPSVLTDKGVARTFPEASKYWLDDAQLLFRSNESGDENLYTLDVRTGKQRTITSFGSDVNKVFVTSQTSPKQIILCVKNPLKSVLYRVDASDPGAKPQLILEDKTIIDVLDVTPQGKILARVESAALPFRADLVTLRGGKADRVECVKLDPEVTEKVVHCDASAVMYDTFDRVPMTLGEDKYNGRIHGYLYSPKHPLPKADRLAMVRAFYGGANDFDPDIQVLSPPAFMSSAPHPAVSVRFPQPSRS